MTTHEYWVKNKEKMSLQHKEWMKKNPNYPKEYYWKHKEKLNRIKREKREKEGYILPRWTMKEIELLIREYPKGDLTLLSQKLNRKLIAIRAKAERLNLFRLRRINLGKKNSQWRGGVNYCYYRRIAFENLPHFCSVCGFWYPNLEVHHKDKNRKNNVLSNLQIVCTSCHRGVIHGIRKRKSPKQNRKIQRGTFYGKHKKK